MDFLESSGLAENTLVVFMGDNGTAASHHTEWAQNGLSPWNAGLYGGKSWGGAEGALRVPCFIRWPGKIPQGSVSDELAAYYDLLPTFLDIAGAKELIPELTDGISLKRGSSAESVGKNGPGMSLSPGYAIAARAVRSGWARHGAGCGMARIL